MNEAIRDVLAEATSIDRLNEVQDDDNLFQAGLVDSVQLLDVVGTLESKLGITVDSDDLAPENFESISAMAHFVSRKKSAT